MLIFLVGGLLLSCCSPLDKEDFNLWKPQWEAKQAQWSSQVGKWTVSHDMGTCWGQRRDTSSRSELWKYLADEFYEESYICIIILLGYRMTRDDVQKVTRWDGGWQLTEETCDSHSGIKEYSIPMGFTRMLGQRLLGKSWTSRKNRKNGLEHHYLIVKVKRDHYILDVNGTCRFCFVSKNLTHCHGK